MNWRQCETVKVPVPPTHGWRQKDLWCFYGSQYAYAWETHSRQLAWQVPLKNSACAPLAGAMLVATPERAQETTQLQLLSFLTGDVLWQTEVDGRLQRDSLIQVQDKLAGLFNREGKIFLGIIHPDGSLARRAVPATCDQLAACGDLLYVGGLDLHVLPASGEAAELTVVESGLITELCAAEDGVYVCRDYGESADSILLTRIARGGGPCGELVLSEQEGAPMINPIGSSGLALLFRHSQPGLVMVDLISGAVRWEVGEDAGWQGRRFTVTPFGLLIGVVLPDRSSTIICLDPATGAQLPLPLSGSVATTVFFWSEDQLLLYIPFSLTGYAMDGG